MRWTKNCSLSICCTGTSILETAKAFSLKPEQTASSEARGRKQPAKDNDEEENDDKEEAEEEAEAEEEEGAVMAAMVVVMTMATMTVMTLATSNHGNADDNDGDSTVQTSFPVGMEPGDLSLNYRFAAGSVYTISL